MLSMLIRSKFSVQSCFYCQRNAQHPASFTLIGSAQKINITLDSLYLKSALL